MWAGGDIGRTRGIDQRRPNLLGWDGDVEGNSLVGNRALCIPCRAGVEGAIEGDYVGRVIVPGDVELTVGADEGHSSYGAPWAMRIIGARLREACPVVGGRADADTAGSGAPCGRVPSHVNVVTIRAAGVC